MILTIILIILTIINASVCTANFKLPSIQPMQPFEAIPDNATLHEPLTSDDLNQPKFDTQLAVNH